jgi:hypothetical protein
VCDPSGSFEPGLARGLINSSQVWQTGPQIVIFAARLLAGKSDRSVCPGAGDLTDEDWTRLDEVVTDLIWYLRPNELGFSHDDSPSAAAVGAVLQQGR